MSEQVQEFQVVVSGDVLEGKDETEVIEAFAKLINADLAKAQLYFQGKPRIIKKRTDSGTAQKFEKALTAIGVDTSVLPLAEQAATAAPAAGGLQLEAAQEESSPDPERPSGPTMICPGCNTLQPQAEQCPACDVYVQKARKAQEATAEPVAEDSSPSRAAADSYGMKAVAAAAGAAFLGALLWMGIAVGFDYELGLVAWLIGGAVGLASAMTGARGSSTGVMCAAMALCAIIGGKFLAYQHFQENISTVMDAEDMWAGEEGQFWFEESRMDAQLYLELDGSEASLRQFMYDRNFADAYSVSDISDDDVAYFLEIEAPTLEWIASSDPSFEQWQQHLMSAISDLSTMDLVLENLGLLDVLFLFLGLSTAYRLGDEGLPG